MSPDEPSRPLFVVRSDGSGFRVVSGSAREALAHLQRFIDLGFEGAQVFAPGGEPLDRASVEALAAQERASQPPTSFDQSRSAWRESER